MKRLLGILLLLTACVPAMAANIDYRALLTNDFTTNIPGPFYVGLNTNRGATMSNYFYQSITGPVSSNYIYSVLTNNAANTNGGTVSSVGLTMDGQVFSNTVPGSPVISSGTLVPGLLTHPANEAFIGPISGADATPTFRSLAAQDLPIVAGTNVIIWTNANVLNIASSGGGAAVNVITNFATTNSDVGLTNAIASIITNEVTTAGFTNEILSISSNSAANVFSNTVPNFIRGTTNQIAKFWPNTNTVGDSILSETTSNFVDLKAGGGAGTTPTGGAAAGYRVYGTFTNATSFKRLDLDWSVADQAFRVLAAVGSAVGAGQAPVLEIGASNVTWAVNTLGTLYPMVDNAYNFGGVSGRIKTIYNGTGGIIGPIGSTGALNYNVSSGGGWYDTGDTMGFLGTSSGEQFRMAKAGGVGGAYFNLGPNPLVGGSGITVLDSFLLTSGVNTWQIGTNLTSATLTTNRIHGPKGSGSNMPGGELRVGGGAATGSGVSGAFIVETATNGAAISTQAGYQTRNYVSAKDVDVTSGVATKLFTVALISTNHVGMLLEVTTECEDAAGEVQCVQDTVAIAIVNKGGTASTSVSASVPTATVVTTGTLTTAITAVNSSGNCDVKMTATTSLTPTVLRSRWKLSQSGNGNMNISPN